MNKELIKKLESIVDLDEIKDSIIFSLKKEEEEKLNKYLEIKSLNIPELRCLRNFLVMEISRYINPLAEKDFNKWIKYNKLITITTTLIDREIYSQGGKI